MNRTACRQSLSSCALAALASLALAFAAPQPATAADAQPEPLVAAASDLQFALEEVLQRFNAETGIGVRVTYGSSGNLARQIAQGAPFELFLSADESYVESLAAQGLTRGAGNLYGIGRIALFVPEGSPLRADPQLEDLRRRLQDGTLGRVAIANPVHAPYGRAAEQALRKLGLWEPLQDRLVLGENVAQAAQFASTGNADGGIIAWSLALAPPLRRRGTHALLPDSLHAPLRQRMVLLKGARPGAVRLYAYLRSDAARAILARNGFVVPQD